MIRLRSVSPLLPSGGGQGCSEGRSLTRNTKWMLTNVDDDGVPVISVTFQMLSALSLTVC